MKPKTPKDLEGESIMEDVSSYVKSKGQDYIKKTMPMIVPRSSSIPTEMGTALGPAPNASAPPAVGTVPQSEAIVMIPMLL